MADTRGQSANAIATNVKLSRIDSDVERISSFARNVNSIRDRIERHAATLGYFSDAPEGASNGTVQPISTNMQTALSDLDRAIDGVHAVLSRFE